MTEDEKAIRDVVSSWMSASEAGDLDAILALMTDDAVFTVPGREPFGKEIFATGMKATRGMRVDGTTEIVELQVHHDWAFTRNHVEVALTLPDASSIHRSGYTLTLFRKEADGRWRLARDANLLTARA